MTSKIKLILSIVFLVAFSLVHANATQKKLLGLWHCYKQHDLAKLSSCLYSIEFFEDGTLIEKYVASGNINAKCRYSVVGNRINVTDMNGKDGWHFDYKFQKNGELFLYKPPWDWKGWLTKDATKVPANHGCGSLFPTSVPKK